MSQLYRSTILIIWCVLLFVAGFGIIPASADMSGDIVYTHSTATLNYPLLSEGGNITAESFTFPKKMSVEGVYPEEEVISETGYPEYVPGSVLVIYEDDDRNMAYNAFDSVAPSANAVVGATVTQEFTDGVLPNCQVVSLPDGITVDEAVRYYEGQPGVAYAQPDFIYTIDAVPNDPYYSYQWGLQNTGQKTPAFPSGGTDGADISAEEAWDTTTGSEDVVIAVIDTGVDYLHDDLAANMWDDGSGNHGYDFVNSDSNPMDDNSHGTHCAGTIAAVGNNGVGVTGVCWDTKIMALKAFNADGEGTSTAEIESINYAVTHGADILSCSWGGTGYDTALKVAIENSGLLVVCAAGNDGTDNDVIHHYPSDYDSPNILSVAATAPDDTLSDFSNYGMTSVDVGAPGTDIYSTLPRITGMGTTVYSEDFSSAAGWENYDNTGSGRTAWGLTTSYYTSAPSSAIISSYGTDWDQWFIKEDSISLAGLTDPVLRYQWFVDTGTNEYVSVGVSDDGETFWFSGMSGNSGGFVRETVDLTDFGSDHRDFAGKNIWIAYRLESDSLVTGTGVCIDDIQVGTLGGMESVYGYMSGTSMATPMVSGVAGLVLAKNPSYTAADLKATIMDSADPISALAGKCVTGGRINAYAGTESQVNASFIVDATSGTSPFTVNFTDTSTGDPTKWVWDFGDGGTSTEQHPSHIYTVTGIYNVSLTVTNDAGTDTITKAGLVTVLPPAPTAEFDFNRNAIAFAENDTFVPGTYVTNYTYRLHAENTDATATFGNLSYVAAADNITWVDNDRYCVWNDSYAAWTFLGATVIEAGNSLDVRAGTATSTSTDYTHTITRVCNVTTFRTDGVQHTNVTVTFDDLDFESVFVGFDVAKDANVTTTLIPGSVTSSAPLVEPLPSGDEHHLKLDTHALIAETKYYFTFDTQVSINGTPVTYKPMVYVWEGMSHTSAEFDETYTASVPAAMLPLDATAFSVTTNTSCDWTVVRQNNLLSVIEGNLTPVATTVPVANFTAAPINGTAPLTVLFVDTSTGGPAAWNWSFGDGNSSTTQHPTHIYRTPGTYTVSLTVTNIAGNDTVTKSGLVTVAAPAPTARFDINRNFIVQTENNTFTAGTYHTDLTYRLHAVNTDLSSTLGNLTYVAATDNITWVNYASCATWNATYATWIFPTEYVISPGSGLDTRAGTSNTEENVYNHSITRIINVSIFRTDGVQHTNATVTFDDLDFESVFVAFVSANNANVTTEIIPESVETNAPLAEPLPSGGDYHLELDTARLVTGTEYYFTFDTRIFLNGSPVIHKPMVYVWEGMSHDSADIGETYKAEVPLSMLPAGATEFSVETNTSCDWSVVRQNNLLSILEGSSIAVSGYPVADFSATPRIGASPLNVSFTDLSTGYPDTWLWTFGDGTNATVQNPVHLYAADGVYTVTLLVNGGDSSSTKSISIRVTSLLLGDANSNGEVNQVDTLRVLKEVVGLEPAPESGTDVFEQTDVHWNGAIDVGDAMYIAQYNVGLRDRWFEVV